MAAEEPVNKKLIFDDLSSPVKRQSFIASPKQPIRLYCRLRPQLSEEVARHETPCLHVADPQTLLSVAPEESFAYKSTQRGLSHRSHQFNFTKVFGPQSTQQEVFDDAVTHILKVCVRACVCCLYVAAKCVVASARRACAAVSSAVVLKQSFQSLISVPHYTHTHDCSVEVVDTDMII